MASNPISGPASLGGGTPAASSSPAKPASAGEADRFSKLLDEPREKPRDPDRRRGSDKDDRGQGEPAPTGGDALLRSLLGGQQPAGEVEAPSLAAAIDDIAGKIADRVLVSDAALDGSREVRIQLKDSILPDTEIRIAQVAGELRIELNTGSQHAMDLLRNQDALLQDELRQRLKRDVVVNVNFAGADASPGDGRSRQRRDIYEEQKK